MGVPKKTWTSSMLTKMQLWNSDSGLYLDMLETQLPYKSLNHDVQADFDQIQSAKL